MSERMTEIVAGGPRGPGLLVYGHVPRDDAIAQFRRCYEHELAEATEALAALDRGEVVVYHQRGVHAVRDRKEVTA